MPGNDWTSLEVVKLVISALTPIAVVVLTLVVTRSTDRVRAAQDRAVQRLEAAERANRRVLDLLIEVHERMAPELNDLYCFVRLRGHFRDIDPPDALQRKRSCDRLFHVHRHLFDDDFRARYQDFVEACFAHFGDPGVEARIRGSRADLRRERGASAPWDAAWDALFEAEPEDGPQQRQAQEDAYRRLMDAFARQLGLGPAAGVTG